MTIAVIKLIGEAKEVICISSFIIQDSEIIAEIEKAANRGVKVYLLTAAEKQVDSPYEDDNANLKDRKEASRDLLIRLGKKALIKTSQHLHSKFILIDPRKFPKGFLFTNNLTVRAMNENIELGVKLEESEVSELFHQFLIGFWLEAEREIWLEGNESKLRDVKKHPEFITTNLEPKKVVWTVSNQSLIKQNLLQILGPAKTSISISAWTFDSNHEISKLLIDKAKEGVKLTIFTRPHHANQDFMRQAIKVGAEIYAHNLLHAKSVLVDDSIGMIMTANISSRGLDTGFETAIKLNSEETNALKDIHSEWKKRSEFILLRDAWLKDLSVPYYDLSQKMELKEPPREETKRDGGKYTAKNMEEFKEGKVDTGNLVPDPNALITIYNITLFPPK
ncbi:MAG: phospholipase D-like domain-containing protein [Cuniculiplasma sp.]